MVLAVMIIRSEIADQLQIEVASIDCNTKERCFAIFCVISLLFIFVLDNQNCIWWNQCPNESLKGSSKYEVAR